MKAHFKIAIGSLLLLWTLILNIYHAGVFPAPQINLGESATGAWFDHDKNGLNNMVLVGPAFARGRLAGQMTAPLLLAQEQALVSKLKEIFPSPILLNTLILGAITWFQGADHYISLDHAREMLGVSLSAPHEFDGLADGFTRQVAYHGAHEVGQMMVDSGVEGLGCTVIGIPIGHQFVVGRNFDFEGGRIFDREKIVKWVFPDHGIAFVSVIWAGMVGAVTGVNAKGVYISINAGGSSEWKRIGVPSTLAALDVLENAHDAEEAVEILKRAEMFITEIFVVLDSQGHFYRIEKSPLHTEVLPLKDRSVVTNHLIAPAFAHDKTNLFRIRELTSVARAERGLELVQALPKATDSDTAVLQILPILRDKGVDQQHQALPLGHRKAIDALIATHSVIYDSIKQVLYVSKGPGVSGGFIGYDLKSSFAEQTPKAIATLPADPLVSPETFLALRESHRQIAAAQLQISHGQCAEGLRSLENVETRFRLHSSYFHAVGDAQACLHQPQLAKSAWAQALKLEPAYALERRQLQSSLEGVP